MEARAIQRTVRQSARKMRLVVDQIRGRAVPEANAILRFSKKLAAKQILKVLKSAVANAEQQALKQNAAFDADPQAHEPRGDPRGGRGPAASPGQTGARADPGGEGRAAGSAGDRKRSAPGHPHRHQDQDREGSAVQETERVSGSEDASLRVSARDRETMAVALLRAPG